MKFHFDDHSLAPVQEKDAWRLCNFVTANEHYLKEYFPKTLKENRTPDLSELFAARMHKKFQEREEYLFVAKENGTRAIMGMVYLKELQKKKGQGEFAYCIGYPYYGKGLMAKMVNGLADWAFDTLGLSVLQIIVHPTNKASIRVAEKCGFRYTAVLPAEHRMPDGAMADMLLYERTKRETRE